MTKPTLYAFWRSSAAWRVRIGLSWKGIDYDYQAVDLRKDGGEQHREEYRSKNPMRQVPLLELEDAGRTIRLTQSMAILEYLEESYPEPPLLPKEPLLRAQARRLAENINAGIQPFQNTATQKYIREVMGKDEKAWTSHWISLGLAALETATAESAGRFAVGDAVSFADVCIVPELFFARDYGIDLTPYPTLTRIEAECAKLSAFQRADGRAQPDAPR